MPKEREYPDQQNRMGYHPARLDRVQGFATAHLEHQGESGELLVVGTFKGERAFSQKHSNTTREMTYRGTVEREGVIYYAEVRVHVEVQVRQAKLKSSGKPKVWQRVTEA